jgi:hypothetical protein
MRHDKSAVFQINDCGAVRLICVRGLTFVGSIELEKAFKERAARSVEVTFLGRFDRIETASGIGEFLDLALGPEIISGCAGPSGARSGNLAWLLTVPDCEKETLGAKVFG